MRHAMQVVTLLFAAALPFAVPTALAQAPDKAKRVGYVVWSSYGPRGHLEQALLDGMRNQGYVEGRNLVVERRYVEAGGIERVRDAADELAALSLDVIVSTCSPSTAAVKQATSKSGTPVVMAVVSDPVGQGLVASLGHPGGNVTGLSSQGEDTVPKMLQLFSAVVPKGARIAVLHNTSNPVHSRLWRDLEQAGEVLGIKLVRIDISGRADLATAFETIARERLGALLVLPDDNMTFNARAQLVELAAKQSIPAIYGAREFVVDGGLMSYGVNYASSYRQAAIYVDKVLKGAKPASLPVEQPTRFEFVVNLTAAKALGIRIPQALLVRTDEVIQ